MLRPNLDSILRVFNYAQKEEQLRDPRKMGSPGHGECVQRYNGTALDRVPGVGCRELQEAWVSSEAGGKPPVGFD